MTTELTEKTHEHLYRLDEKSIARCMICGVTAWELGATAEDLFALKKKWR